MPHGPSLLPFASSDAFSPSFIIRTGINPIPHGAPMSRNWHCIGHLGIFVSGKVAKKEHEEFALNMNLIDVMPPGLYDGQMARTTFSSSMP
jgi:Protein of unknown function (DUF3141)